MTDGAVGEAPEAYWLIKAARYLRVAPWELASQPLIWFDLGLATARAEADAAALGSGLVEGDVDDLD